MPTLLPTFTPHAPKWYNNLNILTIFVTFLKNLNDFSFRIFSSQVFDLNFNILDLGFQDSRFYLLLNHVLIESLNYFKNFDINFVN